MPRTPPTPRVLMVTPEAVPWAKTGGLGDVAGALPVALAARGFSVTLVLPYYRTVREGGHAVEETGKLLRIPVGRGALDVVLLRAKGTPRGLETLFVRCDPLYDRPGLYGEKGRDHPDNAERFGLLAAAACEIARAPDLCPQAPQVIHAHDWQAALVPVLLATRYREDPVLQRVRTLLTVHNLAYQGLFPPEALDLWGLPRGLHDIRFLEFHGQVSALKGGLVFADRVSTVSRRYAREIRTEEFGCGLEGVLEERAQDLTGIPNGIDVGSWDPRADRHLPARYGTGDLGGKRACKAALQRELGLPERPGTFLVGVIGRLVPQKGVDLVLDALPRLAKLDWQLAVLGSGEPELERKIRAAAEADPRRVAVRVGWDEGLAHRIEAGADAFLMPSRFEPCGLNQMYSLRYGTVPIVRAVGGLADTVRDARSRGGGASATRAKPGTGITFRPATAAALAIAVARAERLFRDPAAWGRLVAAGMAEDWSWDRSAADYAALYRTMLRRPPRRPALPGEVLRPPAAPAPVVPPGPATPPPPEWGPPLPDRTGRDRLGLLVQGARQLYAFWETSVAGPLRLDVVEGGSGARRTVASPAAPLADAWIGAEPDRSYRAELLPAEGGAPVLRSWSVRTPRDRPATARPFPGVPEGAFGTVPGAPAVPSSPKGGGPPEGGGR
ncbi:MAG: glycogen synthase GlgA [Planctomycetales bacterium]|nr:glycogen synthase GlgA [Planctomycetales bacterium]